MNKIARILLINTLVIGSVSPAWAGDRFTIRGSIPGVNDSIKVALYDAEREHGDKLAETVTTDGEFVLTDAVKMPTLCEIAVSRKGKDGRFYRVGAPRTMVENADIRVRFTQTIDSLGRSYMPEELVEVEGSESNRQFAEYLNVCGRAELKSKLAGYKSAEMWFATSNDKDTMTKYEGLKHEAEAELLAMKKRFIAEHPDYHISSALTFQELMRTFVYNDAELEAMADRVKVCPDTARVGLIDRALAWSKRYSLERVYPDFTVDNVDGGAKQFSSYVTPGKWTFIDFWASWCGPCRSAIPHVRKLREQYGDRMNVYSISCDESEGAWRKAMDQEKMEWTQLRLNPDQIGEASNLYYISTIPRLILLDADGRIVCSTNLPDEIDEYLSKNLSSL